MINFRLYVFLREAQTDSLSSYLAKVHNHSEEINFREVSQQLHETLNVRAPAKDHVRREAGGQRIVLLTNTRNESLTVLVPRAKGGSLHTVDYGAGYRLKKWGERSLPSDSVTMSGFGVGLVLLGSP